MNAMLRQERSPLSFGRFCGQLFFGSRKNTSGSCRRGLFRHAAKAGAFDKSPDIYIGNLRQIPPCAKSWPKYGDLEVSALLQTAAVVPISG
jgi:hypothetical protein